MANTNIENKSKLPIADHDQHAHARANNNSQLQQDISKPICTAHKIVLQDRKKGEGEGGGGFITTMKPVFD